MQASWCRDRKGTLQREIAARLTVGLVEIEVVCSDERQHRQRVESRISEISGLALPTWEQVLDRRYEPWPSAHIIDTDAMAQPHAA